MHRRKNTQHSSTVTALSTSQKYEKIYKINTKLKVQNMKFSQLSKARSRLKH